MTRQQYLRMRKELVINPVTLSKRIRRKRRCLECGARIKIDNETGLPMIYRFVKYAIINCPWIEIRRKELLHQCIAKDICSYTQEHKIKLMMI